MTEAEKDRCFGQIIDLLMSLNKKLDTLIQINSNLTNTIIKYDSEYQNQIAAGGES